MEICGICLEEFTIKNVVKPCKESDKHIFCKSCFKDWISTFEQQNNQNENENENENSHYLNYYFLTEDSYLNDEDNFFPSCPICRTILISKNNDREIYDDNNNLISRKDYVNNKSSSYFFVKK